MKERQIFLVCNYLLIKCMKYNSQVTKKRKAPTPRNVSIKQQKHNEKTAVKRLLQLAGTVDDSVMPSTSFDDKSTFIESNINSIGVQVQPQLIERMSQTDTIKESSNIVKLKIQNSILDNELKLKTSEFKIKRPSKASSVKKMQFHENFESFGAASVKHDDKAFKFYTGLTFAQFMCLWDFLNVKKINYWKSNVKNPNKTPSKRSGPKRKILNKDQLFMTLIRLRLGLLNQDLAYRFKTSIRQVSTIIITWIQLMYKQFYPLRKGMFASRQTVRKYLPKSFKKYKNIRCIIDCTEVHVQQPVNFEARGNQYSSYKGNTTFKFLVGIAPNGAIMYVSDGFEGSKSDKKIVESSGFLDFLEPLDVIIADRGFLIEDMLNERKVSLIRPPFLGMRQKFTPQEEAQTKDIAKHRIHVERAIERMKKFKILQKIVPQKLYPVFSQMVFVIACLVNFQTPLVK